ncbi:MAG: MCE family protein [Nitrospinae bacterium]|nr:MCE family protein [Nitrospinota bacterium]
MEYKSSEIKAGMFIFLSLIVLAVFIFMLGDVKERFKPKKNVRVVFNFTVGLEVGAPVRYAGLQVGRVKEIDLLNSLDEEGVDRVIVLAQINPSIKVRRDSIASIKTSGLMGGPYLEIRPGSSSSPVLKEGEQLMGQEPFQFTQMGDMVEEMVFQVRKFTQLADALTTDSRETLKAFKTSLESLNAILVDNREEIRENLKNLARVSRELYNILKGNGARIGEIIEHVHSFTQKADRLITDREPDFVNIIEQTDGLTHELEALLKENRVGIAELISSMKKDTGTIAKNISSASNSLDETLHQSSAILIENRRNILELIQNLNESSRNLKAITADVKRNPWKLIRKSPEQPEELKKEFRAGMPASKVRMQRLDKLSKN